MSNKNKKHLDEINAISKEESIGYYAPKASKINGIPTHNIPIVEIVAENPYKLTDYQKAQASKIKDNFKRGQYLKEQDYYNRIRRNKFTDDINYLGIEAQKRLGNLALSAVPGIGTIQPFIKYENGKFKGDFSKEAFIQSGINTALDFVPVGDLLKVGDKKLIKQTRPHVLSYQLNKGINNTPLETSITFNSNGNVETFPTLRPMLNDTKIALKYQIAPRLEKIKPDNVGVPIDKRLAIISDKKTKIISNEEMNNLINVTDGKVRGIYDPKNEEIILPVENRTSVPIETHEASHAITYTIGNLLNNERKRSAYNILGDLKGYAKGEYDNIVSNSKQKTDYEIDEFIADTSAVRQKILKDVGAEKADVDVQNGIFEIIGIDYIINEFANISKYGKDFVERYKNNPRLGIAFKKALQYLAATSGVIATQNNNKQ